jgi:glycosyltransferase involved in cell wall biosynthesis
MPEPYFVCGECFPHKNIETLIEGFTLFMGSIAGLPKPKLVLVGGDDFFYRRLKTRVEGWGISESVIFFGPANDTQLTALYKHARAFVFPSRMEGFGLPALEALSLGCRVYIRYPRLSRNSRTRPHILIQIVYLLSQLFLPKSGAKVGTNSAVPSDFRNLPVRIHGKNGP